ncbi:CCNB1 protein, partial [Rhynochetos jubatus]|nr:CCNB1 protein [Rhynochetos jubatus]
PQKTSKRAVSEDVLHNAFSEILLQEGDLSTDPGFCSSYWKDIYKYFREFEENQVIRPRYLGIQSINGNMRAILINWLVQVQVKFRLHQETLYMTVSIMDRFLQFNAVSKNMLQLVGVTAMFIACKYEEVLPPNTKDFVYITNNTYTKVQICQMEIKILQALDFVLGCPLPPHFLRRAVNIAEVNSERYVLANYLMELSIVDYDMAHFLPSKTAAAASCLALKLNGCQWTEAMQYHMYYAESDLLLVMQHMAKNVILVNTDMTELKAVRNKYASKKNGRISTIELLNSVIIWDLAKPLLKY